MSLILVIEDETQILSNLQEILELADFNVIAAVDGTTGLQLAKRVLMIILLNLLSLWKYYKQ